MNQGIFLLLPVPQVLDGSAPALAPVGLLLGLAFLAVGLFDLYLLREVIALHRSWAREDAQATVRQQVRQAWAASLHLPVVTRQPLT